MKGAHLDEKELVDIFYNAETDQIFELKSLRKDTLNTHGTGCTLSSSLAAYLAHGLSLNEAVQSAKEYINAAIKEGTSYKTGHGHGHVQHFYKFWK